MQKIINLHASGVLKQGETIVGIDYPDTTPNVWYLSICKIAGVPIVFARHTTTPEWQVCSIELLSNIRRDNQDSPEVLKLLNAVQPYAITLTSGIGKVYVNDATETGLYFDGVNQITNAPAVIPTTSDLIKQVLKGTGSNPATGGVEPAVLDVPFYKKPLVWVGAVVVIALGYFAWKNN